MMQSKAHEGSSSARVPWIFLSHSGYQKDFTRRLNEELVHAGHSPFFDQDAVFSLPKGVPFPERILESCQGCKMGIIVLSHHYMESFWPMLELQQLKDALVLLYPLFYGMQPADLTSAENLQHWQRNWDGWSNKALDLQKDILSRGSKLQINTDITSWPAAFKELRDRSGDVRMQDRTIYSSDDAYLKAIVSHVCSSLPPPPNYVLSVDIKGGQRMQQEIDELFNEQVSTGLADGVAMLGVLGIGGSGKSTLCLNMANYYSKDFLGRSCCLELPTNVEDESQQLLHNIKAVLPTLGRAADNIFTLEQAMTCLEEGLNRNKVFLALDNVWDLPAGHGWETAKKIMLMNCMPGSKIMVTSRSKGVLEALFRCRKTSESEQQHILKSNIVHVPSITEDEAMQALMSYSCFSHLIPPEDLRSLARSCFFGEQCYPLYLKTIGAELRAMGKASFSDQEWKKLLFDLQSQIEQGDMNEDIVVDVIKKSFEKLSPELQNVFKDLVTCMPLACFGLHEKCRWLSCLYGGLSTTEMIRNQLLKLEYHGLLEIKEERYPKRSYDVDIHDLHKLVARKTLSPDAPGNHFLESLLGCVSKEELSKYKYIWGRTCRNICGQSNLEILMLKDIYYGGREGPPCLQQKLLSMKSMKALRFLELQDDWIKPSASVLKRCSGWEGAPNLVSLKLSHFRHLKDIGHLGSLLKLEELALNWCDSLKVVNVGKLQKLRILNLSRNNELVEFFFIKKSSKLRKFWNNSSRHGVFDGSEWCPPNLQELDVSYSRSLTSLPNLRDAAGLTTLGADGCYSLREVKISALALTSLRVWHCTRLIYWARPKYSHADDASSSFTDLELRASTLCGHVMNVNGLVNLQELYIDLVGERASSYNIGKINLLNVGCLASLKLLHLGNFPSLQKIACLSSLVALQSLALENCESLKEITGLGALTNLEELSVRRCSLISSQITGLVAVLTKLRSIEISNLQLLINIDLGSNTKLEEMSIYQCSSLQQIIGLGTLTNLQNLRIQRCSSLQQIVGLGTLINLQNLRIQRCSSLQQVIGLGTHLTNLRNLSITDCPLLGNLSESLPLHTFSTLQFLFLPGKHMSKLPYPRIYSSDNFFFRTLATT